MQLHSQSRRQFKAVRQLVNLFSPLVSQTVTQLHSYKVRHTVTQSDTVRYS